MLKPPIATGTASLNGEIDSFNKPNCALSGIISIGTRRALLTLKGEGGGVKSAAEPEGRKASGHDHQDREVGVQTETERQETRVRASWHEVRELAEVTGCPASLLQHNKIRAPREAHHRIHLLSMPASGRGRHTVTQQERGRTPRPHHERGMQASRHHVDRE